MNLYTNKDNVLGKYKFYHPTRHVYIDSMLIIPKAGYNMGTGGFFINAADSQYRFIGLKVTRSDNFPVPENTVFFFNKTDLDTTPPAPKAITSYAGTYLYTKGTNVNLRKGAGTSFAINKTIPASGTALGPVIESFTGADNAIWHRFTDGFVRSDLTTTSKTTAPADTNKSGNDTIVPPPVITPATAGFAGTYLMWGLIITVTMAAMFWPSATGRR